MCENYNYFELENIISESVDMLSFGTFTLLLGNLACEKFSSNNSLFGTQPNQKMMVLLVELAVALAMPLVDAVIVIVVVFVISQ